MIASIKGKLITKAKDYLVVEVSGLGYQVYTPASDWGAAKVGQEVMLHTYEQIREDAHNLYGFLAPEAKDFFEMLLSVSGVGPKVALAVLSAASLERLHQAIGSKDPELLRGVSGVGKKTAERIVLELSGKVGGAQGGVISADSTYQALVGLGYPASVAAQAAAKVPASLVGEQERIKAALKEVGR